MVQPSDYKFYMQEVKRNDGVTCARIQNLKI